MKIYALTKTDGTVEIMRCIADVDPANEVKKWEVANQAAVVSTREITEADIPKDRTMRNAWVLSGDAIVVDAVKATLLTKS